MRAPAPDLLERYAEPHRRYHTLAHIQDCLGKLAEVEGLAPAERRALELAIWWHDAVYDPRRSDNEARSAALARAQLAALGEPPESIAEAERLILLTAGHRVEPGDRTGALMASIDLSILGASPAEYARYAAAVREEYAFVPEPAWRAGRAAVMRRFLETAAIYPNAGFRARLETQARDNIARELAALGA